MSRSRVQTRADEDTVEQIDEYTEDRGISESEAVRRLLRAGLKEKGFRDDTDTPQGHAVAHIDDRVRLIGGAMIGLAVLFLLLSEVGLL